MNTQPEPATGTRWSLLACVLVLTSFVAVLLLLVLRRTGGHLTYAVDDAYIHLAIAKNLVRAGVWGVSPNEFASASSSPLYTAILAGAIRLFGQHDALPLVLNLVFLVGALWAANAWLARAGGRGRSLLVALLALAFLTPLPALVFAGMEHVLHVGLSLVYLRLLVTVLATGAQDRSRGPWVPWVLTSFLLPLARYESLFLISAAVLLLFVRRRWTALAATAVPAALAIVAVGSYFLAHGGALLPNSVLLKGKTGLLEARSVSQFIQACGTAAFAATKSTHMFVLIALLLVLYVRAAARRGLGDARGLSLLFVASAALAHLALGGTGSFFRYEAYLVALALAAIAAEVLPGVVALVSRPRGLLAAGSVAAIFIFLPSLERGIESVIRVPQACKNIHDQQVSMGRFVRQYYNGATVALNDIGAVGYLSDARVVDLLGLGTNEIARLRRAKTFCTADIDGLTRAAGVRIAVVYDKSFTGTRSLPAGWRKVGTWRIADSFVCFDDTVSFYAVQPDEAARLSAALREFQPRLPQDVTVTIVPAGE